MEWKHMNTWTHAHEHMHEQSTRTHTQYHCCVTLWLARSIRLHNPTAAASAVGTDTYLLLSNKLIAPHFHSLSNIHTHAVHTHMHTAQRSRAKQSISKSVLYTSMSRSSVCTNLFPFLYCFRFSTLWVIPSVYTGIASHRKNCMHIKKMKPTRRTHSSRCVRHKEMESSKQKYWYTVTAVVLLLYAEWH